MAEENSLPNRDWLPEDLRFNDSLSKFKDAGSVARSYLEIEKKFGSTVNLPKDDSKPEEWDKFYKNWGRPEKFDGYKFPEIPKDLSINDEFGGVVKNLGHKLGLNQRQFDQLVMWGVEQSQGMLSEQGKASEASEKELKSEWGFRYNDNIEKAHKSLAMLVGFKEDHPFIKYLENNKMGDAPEFLKFLLDVGERFSEDKFIDSKASTVASEKSDAQKQINIIRADAKHPYWSENDPRHSDAVKEMDKLYRKSVV